MESAARFGVIPELEPAAIEIGGQERPRGGLDAGGMLLLNEQAPGQFAESGDFLADEPLQGPQDVDVIRQRIETDDAPEHVGQSRRVEHSGQSHVAPLGLGLQQKDV